MPYLYIQTRQNKTVNLQSWDLSIELVRDEFRIVSIVFPSYTLLEPNSKLLMSTKTHTANGEINLLLSQKFIP